MLMDKFSWDITYWYNNTGVVVLFYKKVVSYKVIVINVVQL